MAERTLKMNKEEFISALREKLSEELSLAQTEGHLHYYDNYISQEMSMGNSQEDVIASLGDPVLLARTILQTAGNEAYEDPYQQKNESPIYYNGEEPQREKDAFGMNSISGWGCFGVAIVGIIILIAILRLVGAVVSAVLPIVLPVIIVLFIITLIKQRR